MFDPETVDLMSQAPSLEGLESERISQEITEAYAEIVSSRIRMRELQGDKAVELHLPEVDLSRNCAAPLTAYYTQKENDYGNETYDRI